MADITNNTIGGVVDFVSGEIRPIAEHLTALKDELNSTKTRWDQIYGPVVGVSGDDYVREGRPEVRDLNAYQIASIVTQINGILTVLNTVGVDDVLEIACVRARSVRS